jgi:glutamate dehydrogenase
MVEAIDMILQGNTEISSVSADIENFGEDALNELAINSHISWREAMLLRIYSAYMFQNKFKIHDQTFVKGALLKHVEVSKLLIKFFHSLFEPNTSYVSSEIEKEIQSHVDVIKQSSEDEATVLSKVVELMDCTFRTNFYQKDNNGNLKNYFAFTINTQKIKDAPKPLPYHATLVIAKDMAGCHLRGGEVARGGIRWSEREDFRMEVLSLMRAQKLKNSIIVPDGAKGGFVVKNLKPGQSKESIQEAGIKAYKTLLRGILDLTDNIVDGNIVKPKDVVCRDGDHTYLVIAADRGTGDFSDIANAISKEYNFWLGDAFASGGSIGYSHKDLAITSRGCWVSVCEHFAAMGIDPAKDSFTVSAIGSMAGDVCGNGLLLSDKMRVLAAFSSAFIFVDPNPDAAKSFAERERLFKLPSSNWIDYNPALISKGGGVFSRKLEKISLSPEMKELFGLQINDITPDDLIKSILKLEVDLLWNGGVGTYVKATSETNEQARDKNTDSVRVDAKDLRCKMVAEGGNLGFTQKARIEYAKKAGRINTDFIDNSGGVDCSDHEVNFKIALNTALANKKITEEERVKLLYDMTGFVVESVLANSKAQNKILSFSEKDSVNYLEEYRELISILKSKTDLDCEFESLPSESELEERAKAKLGLLRAELSILLSYSKRAAYQDLIKASDRFIGDLCEPLLMNYFPEEMRLRFKDEIMNHPLKKEICITKLANNIIDQTGLFFFHLAQESFRKNPLALAKSYLEAADKSKEPEELWNDMSQDMKGCCGGACHN